MERNGRLRAMEKRSTTIVDQNSFRPLGLTRIILSLGLSFTLSLGVFNIKPALAVPSLGVATSGTYYGSTSGSGYITYFTSSNLPTSSNGGYEGFGIGPSGSTLDVFSNVNNEDIYLLTNTDVFKNNDPTFNGKAFTKFSYSSGKILENYKPAPYYGVDLGQVGSSPWTNLPTSTFRPGQFYLDSGKLDYSGVIAQGNYFFAVATTTAVNSNGLTVTNFSPATTSAVGSNMTNTPENSTLVLMGSGLIILSWFGRRMGLGRQA